MKNIVFLSLVLLVTICLKNCYGSNPVVIFNDNGYADDIVVYQSSVDSVIIDNSKDTICKPGWLKCVRAETYNENGFYGFRNTDIFFTSDCEYIEFTIKVIPHRNSSSGSSSEQQLEDGSSSVVTPKIQCSVETVGIPKRITLNLNSTYVMTGNSEDTPVNLLDWSFVRIKLSDLNVDVDTFNSFQIWADQRNTTIIFGGATFVSSPTSLYPIGTTSNSFILKSSFLFVFVALIALLIL
ncbi:hypothetical protein RB653_007246 [Dictyostelium firmibasis]|uniref:Carbohydrate binding domain-containing protein n=1 Tax=Dictyostelium firmibasis TaxID=79012 RepID=A0AAN7YNU8_9MYCE